MYFPPNMNFQYFFFNTYPGYFLQALPIALLFGIIYGIYRSKKQEKESIAKIIFSSIFVSYVLGLLYLTIFMDIGSNIYYFLFYHMPSGDNLRWFTFEYYLIPDAFLSLNSENIGNILMFIPFGILYPVFDKKNSLKRTIFAGIILSVLIELIQPIFGRSFDINDIILNSIGAIISAIIFYSVKSIIKIIKVKSKK